MEEQTRPHARPLPEMYLEALRELQSPHPSVLLPSWAHFNQATGGLRAREFSILCGSTGVGKTTFLANLSAQLMEAKVRHFVASVETGATDFVKRVISAKLGRDVNTGEAVALSELEEIHARIGQHFKDDNMLLSLYEDRIPIETLKADLRHMAQVRKCKVAFIDNLNFFMEVTKAADAVIEMDRVIHELIILCKQIDMHVVMVMHPKKTDGARVLSEFDIKGSSTAVQEAHNVFLLNRPAPEDIEAGNRNKWDRELKIAKMRRRGRYVGANLLFYCEGSTYFEGGLE